jgi:hypothetical protein
MTDLKDNLLYQVSGDPLVGSNRYITPISPVIYLCRAPSRVEALL